MLPPNRFALSDVRKVTHTFPWTPHPQASAECRHPLNLVALSLKESNWVLLSSILSLGPSLSLGLSRL